MAGIFLADLHHGHAVAACFGRQIKVGNFRKLLLQQRHKQLIHGHAQHGRFVQRLAGVGGVVDGVVAQGDAIDREHGKFGLFVVVAGVVAIRPFQRMGIAAGMVGIGLDVAFEHHFCMGGHVQRHADGGCNFRAVAAQQPGKLVFAQRIGHGCDGAQHGGGVGTNGYGKGKRLPFVRQGMVTKIQRTTTVRQPPHDELVVRQQLLPVNAQVLPLFARAARNGKPPGEQRRHIARPAMLNRQAVQIHIGPFPHLLLAGCAAHGVRRHVPEFFEHAAHAQHIAHTTGRRRRLECGQRLPQGTQVLQVRHAHGLRHALGGTKQIAQHRHGVAGHLLEQQSRALLAQYAVAHGRHLQHRRNGLRHAAQLALCFKLGNKFA